MTGRLTLLQCFAAVCLLALLQGCAPIYCSLKRTFAPDATKLSMFEWPAHTDAQYPSGNTWVELRPTAKEDEWLLIDWDSYNPYASRTMIVSDSGAFIKNDSNPDDLFDPVKIKFTESDEALEQAGVTVEFDKGEYSRYLEPEAWGRAIIGYPLAPLIGKAAGPIIDGPYTYRRLDCYPPRVKVRSRSRDGSVSTVLYELPDTDDQMRDYGAAVSEDKRFLYIYFKDQGSLFPINRDP